jgi:PKD repeat protein
MNSVLHAPIPFVAAAFGFLVLMPVASAARQAPPPVAVLDAPATVAYGHDITVSGARSSSPSAIIIKFIWTLDGAAPIETAWPTYTFAAGPAHSFAVGPHTVRLVVVDSAGYVSAPDSATVTVIDNIAPTAVLDAPATIAFGGDLTVSGARSADVGGTIVRYAWTLDGGITFETAEPAFTFVFDPAHPLTLGNHTVRLVVVDSSGNVSAPDAATVRVIDNLAPTAVLDAPAAVGFGLDITVSGARSADIGGSIVRYQWTLDGGPAFETVDPTFTFAADPAHPFTLGSHTVRLVVVDDAGNVSAPDTATVRVIDDVAPTAVLDAPATVAFGLGFTVSGVRSVDIGGSIVRYQWTLDGGPAFETADPDFTFAVDPANPLALGSHTVRLVVVDDAGNVSAPDMATVRVVDRGAPTAVLDAPATVPFGQDITVSGARSVDVEGLIARYRWTLDGGIPIETAEPAFTFVVDPANPFAVGPHVVGLVVVDDAGNVSAPDAATVRVLDDVAPTAVLDAPATVGFGRSISVSGARSVDVGGRVVQYRWRLDGGIAVVTADAAFTFAVDPASPLGLGSHAIELVVVDDSGNMSAPDTATVRVVDDVAPVAVIDAPATVVFRASFTVSGARSWDVGGAIVRYAWSLDGQAPVFSADPAFTVVVDPANPLAPGPHLVQLAVTDDSGNVSAPALRTVTVRYVFTGFFAPVRNLPIVNVASAGRLVSVRWRLSDAAGNPVSSLGSFTSLMSGPIACNAPGDVSEEQMAAADGGPLRYDPDAGQFVFNWRTSREWAGCRLLRLTLADGSRTYAMFRLR